MWVTVCKSVTMREVTYQCKSGRQRSNEYYCVCVCMFECLTSPCSSLAVGAAVQTRQQRHIDNSGQLQNMVVRLVQKKTGTCKNHLIAFHADNNLKHNNPILIKDGGLETVPPLVSRSSDRKITISKSRFPTLSKMAEAF